MNAKKRPSILEFLVGKMAVIELTVDPEIGHRSYRGKVLGVDNRLVVMELTADSPQVKYKRVFNLSSPEVLCIEED